MKDARGQNPGKAYENSKFLHSPWARTIRVLSEYQYPLSIFVREKITGLVVFFGSARIPSGEQAKHPDYKRPGLAELSQYYEDARQLSFQTAHWLKKLPARKIRICTGGGGGIMEAANRGSFEAQLDSIGLNISLPFEQHPNAYIADKYNIEFHYFFLRKYWFMSLARVLVVFPGGFGTMDELMEALTLVQTKKVTRKMPIVLYGAKFWKKVINFEALVEYGVISPEDMSLFQFADTVDEGFELVKRAVIASDPHLRDDPSEEDPTKEATL